MRTRGRRSKRRWLRDWRSLGWEISRFRPLIIHCACHLANRRASKSSWPFGNLVYAGTQISSLSGTYVDVENRSNPPPTTPTPLCVIYAAGMLDIPLRLIWSNESVCRQGPGCLHTPPWASRYGQLLEESEYAEIMDIVKETFQLVNEAWQKSSAAGDG